MKIALVTTTIRVPDVLRLYRSLGPDVEFFVAGDEKTPHGDCDLLLNEVGNHGNYFTPQDQRKLGHKCSELIGWNTDGRRNIAILEALRSGAEIIVTIDDDNLPLDNYFLELRWLFSAPFSGIQVTALDRWFDQGNLLTPPAKQRGVPFVPTLWRADPITGAKIGVVAGTCLGDPDIDAATRIITGPTVHHASELLHAGVVANTESFYVFNSQNTAFLRELAPAMFILPGSGTTSFVGRNADIFASCIMRRVMRDHGLHCHFGKPFVWQTRNPHSLLKDMRSEQLALERVDEFARMVDRFPMPSDDLIPFLRDFYQQLYRLSWWDDAASRAAWAWLDDCERVMA
jgi:hypothetical protein